jgi:hypothetical protein
MSEQVKPENPPGEKAEEDGFSRRLRATRDAERTWWSFEAPIPREHAETQIIKAEREFKSPMPCLI